MRKCPYCDFATRGLPASKVPHVRYADAVVRELEWRMSELADRQLPGHVEVEVTGRLAAHTPERRRDERRVGRMLEYTRSRNSCRFDRIRAYFLGRPGEDCGRCDLCTGTAETTRALSEAEQKAVRYALRTVSELDFRFGAGRVVQVMAGSEASEILDRGLHELDSYGLKASNWRLLHAQLERFAAWADASTTAR